MNEEMGFVNIIKPTGMTSFDVVSKVKKIMHTKRVGHLGTLDPAASGVLPIAVGKATKFFDYFLNKDKVYVAVAKFGIETDTGDSFGNVLKTDKNVDVQETELDSKIKSFIGKINQTPPKYSAVKIDGKRACDLARENVEFEIKSKQIEIFDIKLLHKIDKNLFLLKVHCSAGTYIRTLISDIAKSLNTIATTPVIIRIKSGVFEMQTAVTLEEFENSPELISVQEVFYKLKIYNLKDNLSKKILNGVKVSYSDLSSEIDLSINEDFLIKYNDTIVGLYRRSEEIIEPVVFL